MACVGAVGLAGGIVFEAARRVEFPADQLTGGVFMPLISFDRQR